ncbi:hypothetical protein [Oceanobacillus oncorhynchi]|uniref:hypothetical protein n=1 Tax=Oceanobacillus oncorhynchi TaxID=545501 RepID=UPI0034D7A308
MKNVYVFLSFAIFVLIVSGCGNNEALSTTAEAENEHQSENEEKSEESVEEDSEEVEEKIMEEENIEEDLGSKLENYETIVLGDTNDVKEITVEYPHFSYAPLDDIISSEMEDIFEREKDVDENDEFYENSFGAKHSFIRTFEEPIISSDFVSVYFEDNVYYAAANSHLVSNTINFDLRNDSVISLEEVLNEHATSLDEIAELAAQKLITDDKFAGYREDPVSDYYMEAAYEVTDPLENDYDSFTLSEEALTVYIPQYNSLFAQSEGIVGVELPWDEIESFQDNSYNEEAINESVQEIDSYGFGAPAEAMTALTYMDEEYGFSVDLPESWEGKYTVRESEDYYDHLIKEPSKSIVFSLVEEGMYIGDLFSIEVIEGIDEDEVEEYYEDWPGFEGYIGAGNDVVLVYTRPGMMPDQLYEEPYIETGNQFSQMVEQDMSGILETVEFE